MAADPIDPITDYSQTQRIILLVDLNPLLHLHHSSLYITSLLACAKAFLHFPPLASSLFAFKLFFSSLSPLLSSSKLHPFVSNASSLSFNHPASTFQSLSETLTSLVNFQNSPESSPSQPRALHLAALMRQIVYDYAWDPVFRDPVTDTLLKCNSVVRSNLVILFSQCNRNLKCLSEFLDVEIGDESLRSSDSFSEKFFGFFQNVSGAFDSRDIHFSWVSVNFDLGFEDDKVEIEEFKMVDDYFESGTKRLGWGFCASNSIILGSALVPFGLIYPKIGIPLKTFGCNDSSKKLNVQLNLQILDKDDKPIECRFCDLELMDSKMLTRSKIDDVLNSEFVCSESGVSAAKRKFWEQFCHGTTKFQVLAVQRLDKFVKFKECLTDSIFVCETFAESRKMKQQISSEFFADKVLQMLAHEFGNRWKGKSVPIWQILLSFLYREGFWALACLSKESGDSLMGILRPFTFSSALLSLVDDPKKVYDFVAAEKLGRHSRNAFNEIQTGDMDVSSNHNMKESQSRTSTNKWVSVTNSHSKRNTQNLNMSDNLTWNTFCKAAYEDSKIELDEVYFVRECNDPKKVKFLKYWMKWIKKFGHFGIVLPEKCTSDQDVSTENGNELPPNDISNNRLTENQCESEHPVSLSASAWGNCLAEASIIQNEAALNLRQETSELFFSNLSSRIQQGLESDVVDLGSLAERIVNSCICWLCQKFDREATSEEHNSKDKSDDANIQVVVAELIKLLLREPRDLAAKCKGINSISQASEPGPVSPGLTVEYMVREYELQILFRLEILQSEAAGVGNSLKQKFVKQICLLLENIQGHMEGGFFGDWNLDNYVAKLIKSRYSHTLEDVVHRIYNKMDLLLYDEVESSSPLHNSKESNKSRREKAEGDNMGESNSTGPVSSEDETPCPQENDNGSPQGMKWEDLEKKVNEAKQRRERARRFASFTSWRPDFQRVWAPKQKAVKQDYFLKLSKRKNGQRAKCDRVCETPETENKRSCPQYSDAYDDGFFHGGSQSCSSASRALFQDDE